MPPMLLNGALVLEIEEFNYSKIGKSQITFSIENKSNIQIDFCFLDSGVSTWVWSPKHLKRIPLVLHGIVLDVRCWKKTQLLPRGKLLLTEEIGMPKFLNCEAKLSGLIRLNWDPEIYSGNGSNGEILVEDRVFQICN